MIMKSFRVILLILLICGTSQLLAQSIAANGIIFTQEVETQFSQGVNDFRNGNYEMAAKRFNSILEKYPNNQRVTAIMLMKGKSYYHLGKYNSTLSILRELIAKYPHSHYVDDSHFFIGLSFYKMDNYVSCVRELLWVGDYGTEPRIVEKSRALSLKIIENHLSLDEISKLRAESAGEISRALLTIKLAQKWNSLGNKNKAVTLLENYIDEQANNEYASVMKEVQRKIENQKRSVNLKIGVILPLSSEFGEQAQSVLAGINYALAKLENEIDHTIQLVVKDSEGSIINAIQSATELVQDDRVVAIIGELESEKTASIAPVINYNSVPLIVPVASANGLVELSNYLFQVNGNLESRGELLARYAMQMRHDSTFATLAPADRYGKEMTDSFTATVDRLGGEIIAQKWYYGNTQDMGRQFKNIREIALKRMNMDSLIEYYTKDMTPFQKSKFREITIPATSIDAVFFPIYTEDIKYVVPQFAFVNVKAKMLGGQYWYDINELRNKNIVSHVDSLTIVSDYYFNEFEPRFRNFRTDFRKKIGTTPGEMEYFGFDAMSIILDAIAHNAIIRDAIKEHLENLENFDGIRGPISFRDHNRVNTGQRILTFHNGRFVLSK